MTPRGFRLLVCLFALIMIGGLFAAGPSRAELGLVPTVPCEDWVREPTRYSGAVRLDRCDVDARGASYESQTRYATIDVRGASGTTTTRWSTEDPDWVWLAASFALDPYARARFIARHEDEMVRRVTIVGRVSGTTIDSRPDRSILRPFGLALILAGALALALLIRTQRKWNARKLELTRVTRPTTF
jgi:hypothetical protein